MNALPQMELLGVGRPRIERLGRMCLPHESNAFLGHAKTGVQISGETVECKAIRDLVNRCHVFRRHYEVHLLTSYCKGEHLPGVPEIATAIY